MGMPSPLRILMHGQAIPPEFKRTCNYRSNTNSIWPGKERLVERVNEILGNVVPQSVRRALVQKKFPTQCLSVDAFLSQAEEQLQMADDDEASEVTSLQTVSPV